MSKVNPEEEFARWKAEQEFKAWKASQANAAITDMNALSERSARASEREAKSAEERKLTGGQRLGAATQNALGMASFGIGNLAGDAIDAAFTDRTFAANRQARRMTNEASPTIDRVASTLIGAVGNPVGAIVKAPVTAGLLGRVGKTSLDAAIQGGATGAIEGIEDTSLEGFKQAGERGLMGAAGAVGGTAAVRGLASVARGANTLRRVAQAKPIDVYGAEMDDAMKAADDMFFGVLRNEAKAVGTSPEIEAVLQTKTVKPFADMVRASEKHENAPGATVLLEAYKRMSEAQRRSLRSQEGTAELLAKIQSQAEDIGLAKGRMRTAAEPVMPTVNIANQVHSAYRRDKEAFVDVADAVSRIMRKTTQKGENKIKFESPEALRRGILEMSPSEAEAAIAGLLGRGREAMRLSANPLTGFGIPGAAIRTALLPSQVNPYLRLLEKQAGRQPRLFDNPVVMERGLGALSRTTGGLLSQY